MLTDMEFMEWTRGKGNCKLLTAQSAQFNAMTGKSVKLSSYSCKIREVWLLLFNSCATFLGIIVFWDTLLHWYRHWNYPKKCTSYYEFPCFSIFQKENKETHHKKYILNTYVPTSLFSYKQFSFCVWEWAVNW